MNTFLSRANNIFAFTLTVLATLTFGCFLSTVFKDYKRDVHLKAVKHVVEEWLHLVWLVWGVTVAVAAVLQLLLAEKVLQAVVLYLRVSDTLEPMCLLRPFVGKHVKDFSVSKEINDLGIVNMELKADLTDLFDWNTKELFVYLTAEYTTEKNKLNQVVLWDKIIERGDNAILNYQNLNSEYYFFDDGSGLKGNKNITLYLSWNIIPNAGLLPRIFVDKETHTFAFPDEYSHVRIN